ncbi:MAG TPA: hypothetical protein VLA14_08590 [Polyangia bacterium]|jgi:hypothetical protein|nr:hypothetical protein [Polyangia bacterium]
MLSPRKITPVAALATAVLCSSLVACSKSDPGAASGIPPLPNAPAAAAPAAPSPAPVAPPPAAPPAAEKPADPGARIAGQVVVAPAMRAHVTSTDTIFIVARRIPDNPTARGTLVAVKKVSAAKFPVDFELSAADMPFQNGAFDGDLQLSVRDNKSGDPIMRRKGDVFGVLPKVHVGARGVKLPLDQLQQEDESLAGAQQMLQGQLPPGHPATQ